MTVQTLVTLPEEMRVNVLKFLSARDLIAVSSTCRTLNSSASSDEIWKDLALKTFGSLVNDQEIPKDTWKNRYKYLKMSIQEAQKAQERFKAVMGDDISNVLKKDFHEALKDLKWLKVAKFSREGDLGSSFEAKEFEELFKAAPHLQSLFITTQLEDCFPYMNKIQFVEKIPQKNTLKKVNLSGMTFKQEQTVLNLITKIQKVESLTLKLDFAPSNDFIVKLSDLPSLKKLTINFKDVSEETKANWTQLLSKIKRLKLENN